MSLAGSATMIEMIVGNDLVHFHFYLLCVDHIRLHLVNGHAFKSE